MKNTNTYKAKVVIGLVVMYETHQHNGFHSKLAYEPVSYAELYLEVFEELKKEFGENFTITNIVKL